MQLNTTMTPAGIVCEHPAYGTVATIKRNAAAGFWFIESDCFANVCEWLKGKEFQSMRSAEYAALIILHELESTGH